MTSPAYQTKGAVDTFNSGDGARSIAVPSGTTDGDLLVWVTAIGINTPQTLTFQSGFTALDALAPGASTQGWDIRYRVASSEPASYTVSQANSSFFATLSFMFRVSGIGGTPIAASATKTSETGSGPLSIPSVTTTEADTLLIAFALQLDNTNATISAAGGLTELHQSTSAQQKFLVAYEAIASAGTVSGRTMTVNASGTFSKFAFLVSSGTAGSPDVTVSASGSAVTSGNGTSTPGIAVSI